MPNRELREGLLSSETVAVLSAEEERLWTRLLLVADDFGRFDARPLMVKAKAFPLADIMEGITVDAVERWLKALHARRAVTLYEVEGKPYGLIELWRQRQRANVSKFPPPPDAGPPGDRQTPDTRPTSDGHPTDKRPADDGHMPGIRGVVRARSEDRGSRIEEGSAEQPSELPALRLAPPAPPPVVSLPLHDGSELGVMANEVAEWSAAFPAVDVPQQLRQMRAWLLANPRQRKTRRGAHAFVVRWLGKEQDRGRPRGANGRTDGDDGAEQWRNAL